MRLWEMMIQTMPKVEDDSQVLFLKYLKENARHVEGAMRSALPTSRVRPGVIHEAMRYTALSDGKRLRPVLVFLACEASGGRRKKAEAVAAALEFVHAFSLIHDDLPCMDDDDLRRGKPTNHKVFGEGVAVLAGDALLTLAFELLGLQAKALGSEVAAELVLELARGTGSRGVVGGQVLDLESEGKEVDLRTVQFIHRKKTARLFECALRLGGLTGGASSSFLSELGQFGEKIGVAFQIVDDILGEAGNQKTLGRKPGRDALLKKATYTRVMGLEASHRTVTRLLREARALAQDFPSKRREFEGFVEVIDARRRDPGGALLV